jgi:hypothetical protein
MRRGKPARGAIAIGIDRCAQVGGREMCILTDITRPLHMKPRRNLTHKLGEHGSSQLGLAAADNAAVTL